MGDRQATVDYQVRKHRRERQDLGRAVAFDGSSALKSDLYGFVDGRVGTASIWFYSNQATGIDQQYLYDGSNSRHDILMLTSGFMLLECSHKTLGGILSMQGGTIPSRNKWHHLLCSWDVDTDTRQMYLDDVEDLSGGSVAQVEDISYSDISTFSVGSRGSTQKPLLGGIHQWWLSTTDFIDLTDVNNRRRFIKANGTPAFLGASGQKPLLGSLPQLCHHGSLPEFRKNRGLGGASSVGNLISSIGLTEPEIQNGRPVKAGGDI